MNIDKSIWVAGVARSGTSWIGQIFNSHPAVRFRFQPLFSYEFKARVNEDSTAREFNRFFEDLWSAETPFLTQSDRTKSGEYPDFKKSGNESTLVFKENRYLSVIEPMLRKSTSANLVAVIRNPCAVIHSWSQNPREFPAGSVLRDQWRFGTCKNEGPPDYFGYYKWKEAANLFLDLSHQYPNRVQVICYEQFLKQPYSATEKMFSHCGLNYLDSTQKFLKDSQAHHSKSYYSVYKSAESIPSWKESLDRFIIDEIQFDLKGTRLESFFETELACDMIQKVI